MPAAIGPTTGLDRSYLASVFDPMVDEVDYCERHGLQRRAQNDNESRAKYCRTVHHSGRTFIATAPMADIFAAHAADVVRGGKSELVPLLHRDGIELLFITPATKVLVVPIDVGESPVQRPIIELWSRSDHSSAV